jgi:hypothetical protein
MARQRPPPATIIRRFIGHPACSIPQLRDGLDRFTFFLGGNDGEYHLTGPGDITPNPWHKAQPAVPGTRWCPNSPSPPSPKIAKWCSGTPWTGARLRNQSQTPVPCARPGRVRAICASHPVASTSLTAGRDGGPDVAARYVRAAIGT